MKTKIIEIITGEPLEETQPESWEIRLHQILMEKDIPEFNINWLYERLKRLIRTLLQSEREKWVEEILKEYGHFSSLAGTDWVDFGTWFCRKSGKIKRELTPSIIKAMKADKLKADWNFETEVGFMGYNRHGYKGAFPDKVEEVIVNLIKSPCLHLFSGTSKIGEVRVDLERPEATHNQDVFEFLKSEEAKKRWEWCLLDPPYNIYNPDQDLKDYSDKTSVSASIPKRNALADFFLKYCKNVLWLDQCAPLPVGFFRKKVWFFFPGGYRTIRVLSWLQNYGQKILL